MPTSTDQILARYAGEMQDRQQLIDGLVEAAQKEERDLTPQEMELVERARERIGAIDGQMKPLEEARRIGGESAKRIAALAPFMTDSPKEPPKVEYRTAGAYILDYWKAGLGADEAIERLDLYQRAAAHQTTADNPGLLPEQILGPIVSFIDTARPLVSLLGARQLPSGSWSRPKVTQNTQVALQPVGEKNELVSRKMIIGKLPVTAKTLGGYVNVSRQDIDWTQPTIMDLVVNDLAAQYAIESENLATDDLAAGATVGPTFPTGALTAAQVNTAFWTAAASVFAACKGQGRLIAVCGPDMLGHYGPLFPPVSPQNAITPGFEAVNFATGLVGSITGIPVYVTAGMPALTTLVMSTAAAEVYEDRIGALQVVEPSVLGVQIAYAGYFADLVLQATGIQKLVKTP